MSGFPLFMYFDNVSGFVELAFEWNFFNLKGLSTTCTGFNFRTLLTSNLYIVDMT